MNYIILYYIWESMAFNTLYRCIVRFNRGCHQLLSGAVKLDLNYDCTFKMHCNYNSRKSFSRYAIWIWPLLNPVYIYTLDYSLIGILSLNKTTVLMRNIRVCYDRKIYYFSIILFLSKRKIYFYEKPEPEKGFKVYFYCNV